MAPPSPELLFERGAKVEVCTVDPGFVGAWFEATVVRCSLKMGRLSVDYDRLVSDDDPYKPHHEVVAISDVRPRPPPPPPKAPPFRVGDEVEVLYRDCWWAGYVLELLHELSSSSTRFVVRCVDGDVLKLRAPLMRHRLDWVDGKWVSFPNPLALDDFFSNCKIGSPMNEIEAKLEFLVEMENQGYKIEATKSKIIELINLKEKFSQCVCKLNSLENKMRENKHIIGGMNMDIEELEESLLELKKLREKGKSKIADIHEAIEGLMEQSQYAPKCIPDLADERIAAFQENISRCEEIDASFDSRIFERQRTVSCLKNERDKQFTELINLQKEMEEMGEEAQKCRLDFIKVAAASL